ncbi:MAG: isocitrate lyase/phosphoenolpyruvate mutase family protein [Gammaproteobacteria bacterium]|nr:isocitrate lyase/phosphoenolpyruvate mutase family protein [Gammaproteobacteria bacterium]
MIESQNSRSLQEAAEAFRLLHSSNELFVMPCAWDAFSAMMFEKLGFRCIGTTSGGVNWVRGRMDYVYSIPKKDMLSAYGEIAQATNLPTSGDLENGYGRSPEEVAETIQLSVDNRMVGGSIEDQDTVPSSDNGNSGKLIDFDLAVARIRAARQSADASGICYTLTARCEVYYTDHEDPYSVAVKRLNAYREAGADCLFAPGLNDLTKLGNLVRDVDGPISFGMGATEQPLTLTMLEDLGVRRVSTGGGLARATFGLLKTASEAILQGGSFDYLDNALSETQVNQILHPTD